jgi:hypothetical protein
MAKNRRTEMAKKNDTQKRKRPLTDTQELAEGMHVALEIVHLSGRDINEGDIISLLSTLDRTGMAMKGQPTHGVRERKRGDQ